MATKVRNEPIIYPDSDGKPMAESDVHIDLVIDLRERLKARYADNPKVYVAGNLLVYYVEGQPRVSLAPDGFVVFGVPNKRRRSYKVWEEGRYPDVIFEFTSASTQGQDLDKKFEVYQDLWKVKEYFLFDPLEEYLDPPLLGYRLHRGEFIPIKPEDGVLISKVLGITLSRDRTRLILRDAKTGTELLTKAERRAATAESEVARLKAELAALRRKSSG
jgi:Uma2 family endonuclease